MDAYHDSGRAEVQAVPAARRREGEQVRAVAREQHGDGRAGRDGQTRAERLPRGADPHTHTKLGRGGLSDVEWTVQLVQLRHGDQVPGLRIPATLPALRAAVNHPDAQKRVAPAAAPDEVSAEEVADIERRMRLMGYM